MRTHHSAIVGVLLCSYGVPTGTSFNLSSSSNGCKKRPSHTISSVSSTPHHDTTAWRTGSDGHPQTWRPLRRCNSNPRSRPYMTNDGPAAAALVTHQEQQQYTAAYLEGLSRRELQALCKNLNLRAVGRTSELISRVSESYEQQRQSRVFSSAAAISNTADATSATAATGDLVGVRVETLEGDATNTQQPCVVDDIDAASSTSSKKIVKGRGAAAAVDAALRTEKKATTASLPIDFGLKDVRPGFDELSDEQWAKVGQLGQLLTEWNDRINLISRKDIANVMKRHVLPCLAMAKALNFEDGTHVLDVGTGGGLPGLPLAICFPNVNFTLIDGRGKKITAVADMADRLGLTNVRTFHIRAEEVYEAFDFVMGRAVTNLPKFVGFIEKNLKPNDAPKKPVGSKASRRSSDNDGITTIPTASTTKVNSLSRGVLYMRGEVSEEELLELGARPTTIIPLQQILEEAGESGDVGLGSSVDDRGYSSVFHFASEAIWHRVPTTP